MMSSLKWLQNREKKIVTPVASLAKDIRDVAETITNVWRHFWKSPELELCSNPTMSGSLRDCLFKDDVGSAISHFGFGDMGLDFGGGVIPRNPWKTLLSIG